MRLRPLLVVRPRVRYVRTQASYEYVPRDGGNDDPDMMKGFGLANPRQLVKYLDSFVVGQETAKKVLSVAVYNHYNRVRANLGPPPLEPSELVTKWSESQTGPSEAASNTPGQLSLYPHPYRRPYTAQTQAFPPLFEKSNVLVIGPTGSGKTLLARTLAKVLDVPFSVSDATTFTQAGYVGEDVEMCIHRLLQAANWDVHRASMGIVYIDEADKLARRSTGDGLTRDVGGEGVQQSLLRMMEGSVVTVQTKASESSGGSAGENGRGRRVTSGPKHDMYQLDTSNVLFILSGAFVGLDSVVRRRVSKGSIGFNAPLTPSETEKDEFMPFFTPNGKPANLLDLVEPADLIKYGYIPEFISRLPTLTTLQPLSTTDLMRILTEVRGSLVSQYTALFGYSGVDIRFTTPALRHICKVAKERGGGARGLRGIMENLLLTPMYEAPGSSIRYVLITEAVARGEKAALYWSRGEGAAFWTEWAQEEERAAKQHLQERPFNDK